MAKRISTFRVRKNRLYTTKTAAEALGVKTQTVQVWIWRDGLPVEDEVRPRLIRGSALITFFEAKKKRRRYKLGPTQFACLSCKAPREAAFKEIDLIHRIGAAMQIRAICPECGKLMHLFVSSEQLAAFARTHKVINRADL